MNNLETFRIFLQKNNPVNGVKAFNLNGIEKELQIPKGTFAHFLSGRRGLGANEAKIIEYFRNRSFEQHIEIGEFSITTGDKVTIQDTITGEYAEFEPDLFEAAVREFMKKNF